MKVECGPLTFISDFDSGNFLKAELVPPPTGENAVIPSSSFSHQGGIDYEVNIWTKPDAFGTKYQNGNRTWFYFAVKGGKSNGMLKLNILSLNKQIKLFEQGMQPVIRVLPQQPFWERVRDRISVKGKDSCSISFRQRLPVDPSGSTLFIAFTYPFAYSELCEWLDKIDDLYANGFFTPGSPEPNPNPSRADLILQRSTAINNLNNPQHNIYYHRECVCMSLEGRRVELITISSYFGQSEQREDSLEHLFPDRELRPFKFPNKKVVLVSARVHPGETPAQFVFNGFMRFLLEPKDPRAILLRKLFVFKLIPILNPDGVADGHYRTDPRGVNLNRVYLRPSPLLHPSIYAARKLILYHHFGHDCPDDYVHETGETDEEGTEELENCNLGGFTENSSADDSNLDLGCNSLNVSPDDSDTNINVRGPNSLCAGCITRTTGGIKGNENEGILDPDNGAMSDCHDYSGTVDDVRLHQDDGHQCTFESCDEDSIADFHDANSKLRKSRIAESFMDINELQQQSNSSSGSIGKISEFAEALEPSQLPKNRKTGKLTKKDKSNSSDSKSKREMAKEKKRNSQTLLEGRGSEGKQEQQSASTSSFDMENGTSGLFLYIDIHAHATKRGIFMYGNHFPDPEIQAECMLFPRLMAMNSQHFDFAACNFTERLMNLKDRRDGASREGSGRVAVLKLTGLVRSYTLECNYNTGRVVNHMHQRPLSFGFNEIPYNSVHPPKFTPDLFEQCGRGLAESLLDLTGSNPWSRLNFTEFRTLDGMRRFLLRRLSHSPEFCNKKKNETPSTIPKKFKKSSEALPSSSSPAASANLIYHHTNIPESHSHKHERKLNRQTQAPAIGPLVPKKENQSNNVLSPNSKAPTSSKLGSSKLTKLYNKPTTSSAAKIKEKLKHQFVILPNHKESADETGSVKSQNLDNPQILPKVRARASKTKKMTSSSLTQVFKTKKKLKKKNKGSSVSTSDLRANTSSSSQ